MAEKRKCPLDDCNEVPSNGTGYAAHCRSHVVRGEANYAEDGKSLIRVPGIPIVTAPYDRKLRMDAIRRGEIVAQIHVPTKKEMAERAAAGENTKSHHKKKPPAPTADATTSTAIVKRGPGRPPKNANGNGDPFDITKLTPSQRDHLRAQLNGEQEQAAVDQHSCPATRAVDRMKDAIVMTTVAEMLESVPADQMLVMITQMRHIGPLPSRRR